MQSVVSMICHLSKINYKYHFPNDEVILPSLSWCHNIFLNIFKNSSPVFQNELHPTKKAPSLLAPRLIKIPLLHVDTEFGLDSVSSPCPL